MDQFPTKKRRFRQRITPAEQAALGRALHRILTPEQRADLRQAFREYAGAVSSTEVPPQKRARAREKRATLPEKRGNPARGKSPMEITKEIDEKHATLPDKT